MQKQSIWGCLFLAAACASHAPATSQPGAAGPRPLEAMVAAERAFARLAEEQSTRQAFLTYLREDAVTFTSPAK